jgi:hypothetical protein
LWCVPFQGKYELHSAHDVRKPQGYSFESYMGICQSL